jgi:hypothetical protein
MMYRAALCSALGLAVAQGLPAGQTLTPLRGFPTGDGTTLRIEQAADPRQPFSVAGPHGALLGRQDGDLEAWVFPWKIFENLRIAAQQPGGAPVELSAYAAQIETTPSATILTYRLAGMTLRQTMFAPQQAPEGAGAAIVFQVTSAQPVTLLFQMTPRMERMWPVKDDPTPQVEEAKEGGSEFCILKNGGTKTAGALAMPQTEANVSPRSLTFVLHYSPAEDRGKYFPLLMTTAGSASAATLGRRLAALDAALPALYAATAAHYREFRARHTAIETPDATLNAAYAWAQAAIDQMRAETPERRGEALTAGYAMSGDGTRPGFGWFFGRDSLWTLYAIDSYGDFATARQQIEFLLRRQRADGKIMHEYSQTANQVDWGAMEFYYAAADATPLLLMAANDYLRVSGDVGFIRAHWEGLARAWAFETGHVSDDGVYNNTQGTGWVESWTPKMPYQEIYLAALDEQASLGYAQMARAVGQELAAAAARVRAAKIGRAIEQEYFVAEGQYYAFSRNEDGTLDPTATIFPAVAWWDGTYQLGGGEAMMRRWASEEFSTDWGTRDLSDATRFYDPNAYHQGTVWPLYTGWVALAEYRAGRPLNGYTHLMENAELTWSSDPGTVTELLSGQKFETMGTPHQLWSSAMVVTPVLRGMFGLGWNAGTKTLTVTPQLPADWKTATVRRIPLGNERVDLRFTRSGQTLVVTAQSHAAGDTPADQHPGEQARPGPGHEDGTPGFRLSTLAAGGTIEGRTLRIPLPPVEAAVARHLPQPGAVTQQMKVLDEAWSVRSLTLRLAGQAGTQATLTLRENAAGLRVQCIGGTMGDAKDGLRPVTVAFPAGSGSVTATVTFVW